MSGNEWVRQIHRWLSIVFTLTVILNFAVLGQSESVRQSVVYLPLPPLGLLLFSGLYLFALPYLTKRRKARERSTSGGGR